MDTNKMREQFEKFMLEKLVRELMVKADGLSAEAAEIIVRHTWLERDGDGYKAPVPNYCWWSWQASREALVVELPEPDDSFENHEYLIDRELTVRAIEAQGLKVAP